MRPTSPDIDDGDRISPASAESTPARKPQSDYAPATPNSIEVPPRPFTSTMP